MGKGKGKFILCFYFNICTVRLYYLYNEPTNAQLINNLMFV